MNKVIRAKRDITLTGCPIDEIKKGSLISIVNFDGFGTTYLVEYQGMEFSINAGFFDRNFEVVDEETC